MSVQRMDKRANKTPRLAELAKYRRQGGRICGVCASPHRKFVEEAIAAGNSKRAVKEYLSAEFGVELPSLNYHVATHVTKKA